MNKNSIHLAIEGMVRIAHENLWDTELWLTINILNQSTSEPIPVNDLKSYFDEVKIDERKRREGLGIPDKIVPDNNVLFALPRSQTQLELMSKDFPFTNFIIEPFFERNTLNMISAPPNTWKSWVVFNMANCLASGALLFGKFKTEKMNVMIVNEEDAPRSVQNRLKIMGSDPSLPIYYYIAVGTKLTDKIVKEIIDEAKRNKVEVIFFDSLRAIHNEEENDSTSMQKVMDMLRCFVKENITVVFTHHHRKRMLGRGDDDAEASRGSTAINAAISGHISIAEESDRDEKSLIIRHLKSKATEKIKPIDVEIKKDINPVNFETLITFNYLGEHAPSESALVKAKELMMLRLKERDELLGRKDFMHLNCGGETTIKKVTKLWEKEPTIFITTRKEAKDKSLKVMNQDGKQTEKLYGWADKFSG
jgi:hypothetical protein